MSDCTSVEYHYSNISYEVRIAQENCVHVENNIITLHRRKHHGKLALFSERVKRKPSSRSTKFIVHSSPLHGGLEDNDGKHINNEKLEMSTFGKSDSKIYKGMGTGGWCFYSDVFNCV